MDVSLRKAQRKTSKPPGRIRMVLMFDEAKTLVDLKYYNAFRWVLDNVIEQAWQLGRPAQPLPFFAVFLGTNSKVADFLPPGEDSSYRYFSRLIKVPQPFTALDWDVYNAEYKLPSRTPTPTDKLAYSHLADMSWLSRFGRPIWNALWKVSSGMTMDRRCREAGKIIRFAENKLHHCRDGVDGFKSLLT